MQICQSVMIEQATVLAVLVVVVSSGVAEVTG